MVERSTGKMAALVAPGEVEVTNVEEVAEGRVRGLADPRSVDVSRAAAFAFAGTADVAVRLIAEIAEPADARAFLARCSLDSTISSSHSILMK